MQSLHNFCDEEPTQNGKHVCRTAPLEPSPELRNSCVYSVEAM